MNLLKISLSTSIIGIFILLLIIQKSPEKIYINQSEDYLNKIVQIKGNIKNIKNYNDFQIIKIKDSTGEINILINDKLNLTSKNISVIGILKKYNQDYEITAEKIYYAD